MTDDELRAVTTTLGLTLDALSKAADASTEAALLRGAIEGLGQLLASRGGLGLMARAIDIVLDDAPHLESERERVLDRCWSGIGGWAA